MVPKLSERAQAFVFASILIASVAGLYAAAQSLQPPPVRAYTVSSPYLDIEGSGWRVDYRPSSTANNTVFLLLLEASAALQFSVYYQFYQLPQGVFVIAINGTANGQGGYWQYWVDGVYGDVAADHRALHDHDVVLWNFTVSQGGG